MESDLSNPQDLQALLDNLTAGAEQPIFSAAAWAARLGDSPAARAFAAQLAREWRPVAPNGQDAFGQRLTAVAQAYLASIYEGWPHLWGHTLRVTGIALALAPEAGVDPEHAFVLGVLHDIGKLDEIRTGVEHELVGALMTRQILHDYPGRYPPEVVERLANTIAKQADASAEPFVWLLYDADKLDKIGAAGIMRRLTTDWGAQHRHLALRQVELDLYDFPKMHYPTSRHLAEIKREFSALFIEQVRVAVWL